MIGKLYENVWKFSLKSRCTTSMPPPVCPKHQFVLNRVLLVRHHVLLINMLFPFTFLFLMCLGITSKTICTASFPEEILTSLIYCVDEAFPLEKNVTCLPEMLLYHRRSLFKFFHQTVENLLLYDSVFSILNFFLAGFLSAIFKKLAWGCMYLFHWLQIEQKAIRDLSFQAISSSAQYCSSHMAHGCQHFFYHILFLLFKFHFL